MTNYQNNRGYFTLIGYCVSDTKTLDNRFRVVQLLYNEETGKSKEGYEIPNTPYFYQHRDAANEARNLNKALNERAKKGGFK